MTESIKSYARVINVNLGEDIKLDYIALKGYNELLPVDFVYKVVDGAICYKNLKTSDIYKIHPNYRKFRNIVSSFKSKLAKKKCDDDTISVVERMKSLNLTEEHDSIYKESEDFLKDVNDSVIDREKEVVRLKEELNGLDLKFERDILELDEDLKLFHNVAEKDTPEFIRLWGRYREMSDCKKDAKLVYRQSKDKLLSIKQQITELISPIDLKDKKVTIKPTAVIQTSFDSDNESDNFSEMHSNVSVGSLSDYEPDRSEFVLPKDMSDVDLEKLLGDICSALPSTKLTQDLIASYDL